jgi:hypothetical protein
MQALLGCQEIGFTHLSRRIIRDAPLRDECLKRHMPGLLRVGVYCFA